MKRLGVSFLLIFILMIVGINPSVVFAGESENSGSCGTGASWNLDVNGVLTISGQGDMENYEFYDQGYYDEPAGYYYPIATTNAPWFEQRESVKKIVVSEGISSIGANSFCEMTNLNSVVLPESLEKIGPEAFYSCTALTSIKIPDNVRLMANGAFWNCSSLREINIPSKLKTLSRHSIEGTAINELTIPATLETIEAEAIWNLPNLEKVVVADGNPSFSSYDDCLYDKSGSVLMTCPAKKEKVNLSPSLTSIGVHDYGASFTAFNECKALKSIAFDNNWEGTDIGESWFADLPNLKSIIIPEGVQTIAFNAFSRCGLEYVALPSSVVSLDYWAFGNMPSLKTISIPQGVNNISFAALDGSKPVVICEQNSYAEEFANNYGYNTRTYTIDRANTNYTGMPIEPSITVKQGGKTLTANIDYTVSFANNIEVGKAIVHISGIGDYKGDIITSFDVLDCVHEWKDWTITKKATELSAGSHTRTCAKCGKQETQEIAQLKPSLKAVTILKPKTAKKSVTIKWKKVSKKNLKKIKKIEIQYSTDKNFKKNVKSKYAKATKTSYKIKKLKSKKKYYVRIRAYTKSGGQVHVSKWSTVKKVKAK